MNWSVIQFYKASNVDHVLVSTTKKFVFEICITLSIKLMDDEYKSDPQYIYWLKGSIFWS